jgi:hypothetical protein
MPLGQSRYDGKIRRWWRVPSPRRCRQTRLSMSRGLRDTLLDVGGCLNLCMNFWVDTLGAPRGDNCGNKM